MTTAEKQYHRTKAEITVLMDFAKMELERTPDHITYGNVGDVGHIREQLFEMLIGMTVRPNQDEDDAKADIVDAMRDAMDDAEAVRPATGFGAGLMDDSRMSQFAGV